MFAQRNHQGGSMKRTLGFLLFLSAIPVRAQDAPVLERATVVATRGDVSWGIGIRGQAVGFMLSRTHSHVTVSARLGNGGGRAYAEAYLMKDIGPGTTLDEEIAFTSFDLEYPFEGWVDLFNDVELTAGRYWLVIAKPRDRPHSSINWFVVQQTAPAGSCSGRFFESKAYTFQLDEAEYIPASKFEKKFEPYVFQFEVTELRAAGEDPCP